MYFNQYKKEEAEQFDILRLTTDQIMEQIRIASKGYGCPRPLLKDLMVKGILNRNMFPSKS